MKVPILGLSLILFAQSSAFAGDVTNTGSQNVGVTIGNITITNKSEVDLAYRVSGAFPGFAYGIKVGEQDLYVFKGSDKYNSQIETAECYKMDATGGACTEYGEFQRCMNGEYGDFKRYNFVELYSAETCELVNAHHW